MRISALIGIADDEIARVGAGPGAPGSTEHEVALPESSDQLCRDHEITESTWGCSRGPSTASS